MSTPSPRVSMLPWLLVGAVLLLIAGVIVYQRSGPDAPPPIADSQAKAASRDTRSPHNTGPRREPRSTTPPTPELLAQRRAEAAERRAESQQRVDRTQAAFSSRYQSERVDGAWAGSKAAALRSAASSDRMQELDAEPRNLSVDCKSTMCRVNADFATMTAGDDWITLYMNTLGDQVPTASYKYRQNDDGTFTIDMYAVGRR